MGRHGSGGDDRGGSRLPVIVVSVIFGLLALVLVVIAVAGGQSGGSSTIAAAPATSSSAPASQASVRPPEGTPLWNYLRSLEGQVDAAKLDQHRQAWADAGMAVCGWYDQGYRDFRATKLVDQNFDLGQDPSEQSSSSRALTGSGEALVVYTTALKTICLG